MGDRMFDLIRLLEERLEQTEKKLAQVTSEHEKTLGLCDVTSASESSSSSSSSNNSKYRLQTTDDTVWWSMFILSSSSILFAFVVGNICEIMSHLCSIGVSTSGRGFVCVCPCQTTRRHSIYQHCPLL
jgi:hypothetical protein